MPRMQRRNSAELRMLVRTTQPRSSFELSFSPPSRPSSQIVTQVIIQAVVYALVETIVQAKHGETTPSLRRSADEGG